MSDPFEQFEKEFAHIILPDDPLEIIVEESQDPIKCAQDLDRYVQGYSDEVQAYLTRQGIAKLAYKHYGPYYDRDVMVVSDGAFAVPEKDAAHRKREVMHAIQFDDRVHAIGKLATFQTCFYKNEETGDSRFLITLEIAEPWVMDADGTINRDIALPDYMIFPIPRVLDYHFGAQD